MIKISFHFPSSWRRAAPPVFDALRAMPRGVHAL
jgi:hypothetical protein